MFAANNRISNRGIRKLIIMNGIGISLLISNYFARYFDLLTGTTLLTLILCFSLFSSKLSIHYSDKLQGRFFIFKKSFHGIFISTFAILALLGQLQETILPGTNILFLLFAIYGTAFFISKQDIEVRSRFCELLFPFTVIPILITIAISYGSTDFSTLPDVFRQVALPNFAITFRNVRNLFLIALFSYIIICPWEYFPDLKKVHTNDNAITAVITKSLFTIYAICILQFVAMKLTYPIQPIFPIAISIIFYISTPLYYASPTKKCLRHTYHILIPALVFILLLIPPLLQTNHLYTYLAHLNFDALYKPGQPIIDAKELENRCFVLSVIISSEEEPSPYTFELTNLDYDTQKSSDYISVVKPEDYEQSGGRLLDFSHLQAIILTKESNWSTTQLLDFTNRYRIPDTTLIFHEKDFPKLYNQLIANISELHLGKVLTNLADNQDIRNQLMLRNLTNYDY